MPSEFQKGKAVHISIDNTDERQHTLTWAHTTHYTRGTVFQVDVGSEETARGKNQNERREWGHEYRVQWGHKYQGSLWYIQDRKESVAIIYHIWR